MDCPEWIPAGATVNLVVPANTTYVALVYCVDNPQSVHCLTAPQALEAYKVPAIGGTWPAEVDIKYYSPTTVYCDKDLDCPNGQSCTSRVAGADDMMFASLVRGGPSVCA